VKGIEVPLRFSTSILRRLGEELNPSPDQSILELVKNSYDADAVDCTIELIKTDHAGGTIKIYDNGDGMDAEAIKDGWLVLGQSLKPPGGVTRLKRIRAGSKGLGRLAALRMGSSVMLVSRTRKDPTRQFRLAIDWSDYDKVALVEDVILTIKEEPSPEKSRAGTEIILENLRDSITRINVKKLARSLLLLADPFGENPEGFKPILKAPEFGDLEALVKNRYFKDAEYHLIARVDKSGKAHATVTDWRGEELFSAAHKDLNSESEERLYKCPPSEFDLWAFILNKATFDTRSSTKEEVRNWLQTFGGVHLYQNGLRVNPYGNPGNDWLEINLLRVRSPEERPSTNNSIGRVSVLDPDELLVQKTDRSGFIENETFAELKRFAINALEWMAKRRLEIAEKRRAKERTETTKEAERAKESVQEVIERSPKPTRESLKVAFAKYDHAKQKEVNTLRKEVQLYRTLSTAGITAATFAHESAGNPIKVISLAANTVARRGHKLLGEKYTSNLEEPVGLIRKSINALKVLGNVTLSLTDHEKRRAGRVDIHRVIKNLLETFQPFLAEREVNVIPDFAPDSKPFLRGSEAAFESIITNFLNNSIVWFAGMQIEERKVVIRTRIAGNILTLRVFDNGPGIVGISIKDIWLPGYTTRPNGTGLGLTIVRDAVTDLGGTVDAIEHGELGGAEFIIELPILGA
jgi:nitrogen-specific signal transduction histidine kinase